MDLPVTDEVFNQENTLIVVNQNSLSYKNFGRCLEIILKYPYGDVAGLRKPDPILKLYSCLEGRDEEGDCIFKSPPHYKEGPTIATLITQFGIGRPFEENNVSSKVIEKSQDQDLVERLKRDTRQRRLTLFNKAMFKLGFLLSSTSRDFIKNIIIPTGIGRSGSLDDVWIRDFLPVIHRFSLEMSRLDKRVVLLLKDTVRNFASRDFKNRTNVDPNLFRQFKTLIHDLPCLTKEMYLGKENSVEDDDDDEEDVSIWDRFPGTQDFIVIA